MKVQRAKIMLRPSNRQILLTAFFYVENLMNKAKKIAHVWHE